MPLPVPQITDDNARSGPEDGDGELLITRCTSCGYWTAPAVAALPEVPERRRRAAARERRGHGLRVHDQPPGVGPRPRGAVRVAIVELDEQPGLRLMTNIVDCPPEEVEIGMPVEVAFVERGEVFVPVFHKVAA